MAGVVKSKDKLKKSGLNFSFLDKDFYERKIKFNHFNPWPLFFLINYSVKFLFYGLKQNVTIKDCEGLSNENTSRTVTEAVQRNWFKEINRAKQKGRAPRLWRALFWTFIWGYMVDGVFLFLQMIFCKPFQPVMLALLVRHFAPNGPTRELACYYAGGLVAISLISVIIQHNCVLRQMQRGMRLRVACCSLLYRKILRMSNASLGQTTAGQVINLMSNDVSRFDTVLIWLHYLWIMPFQIALMCYLIYTQVDMAAVIGVMVIIAQTMPVQSYLSRLSSKFRLKIAQRTDERVRLMNEIISGIQVIKMYAWEKPFEKVVEAARIYELKAVMNASYLRGVYMSFMVFTERASLYITLLAYSLMGNPISAAVVFSLAQFYNRLQETLAFHYPNAVILGAECLVTIKRIEDFLLLAERDSIPENQGLGNLAFEADTNKLEKGSLISYDPVTLMSKPAISLEHVDASWVEGTQTLKNINLEIPKGKLCAVIGTVGAGKSSLLQLLLKELPVKSGKMKINGTIAYASQDPWLFVATVRNNILFGQPYDHDRYRQVIKACALESDFQQFPRGDQTLVGERGVSLSGGQRARINLARAVYRQADIYLMDDPLSAVDAPVGRHLFEKCIKTYMVDTTRVLVTHQLHYLKAADIIIILKEGKLENMGTYSELASSGKQFAELLSALEETPHDEDDKHHGHGHSVVVGAGKEHDHDQFEAEQEIEEDSGNGRVSVSMYWGYWMAGKNSCLFAFMIIAMIFGQLTATVSDYFVTFWSNEQTKIDLMYSDLPADIGIYPSKLVQIDNHKVKNETEKKDFSIWDSVGPLNTVEYLYIYSVIIFCCIFFVTGRALVFFKCCIKSSKGLHDAMFHSMLKGTMRFFDTNASGRILNRFSKDIGAVDELLPRAYMDVFQVWLVFLSIICLVSATNPWLLMPIAFIILVFYLSLQLYLNTAQDIKRLESVYRSPVYSHLTASLNGIITIRASNSQKRLLMEFDQHQDSHSIAWYQYLACSCTLGFWLDIVCVLFLACVSFSFIFFNNGNVSAGYVGLAISQTMILMGMLQFGVRQIAEVVAQMTSVERVLQYTNIPEEQSIEFPNFDASNWPSKGAIKFQNTKLFYSPSDPPVLQDLNFEIESGWKVGIVGRTGAGKSSLIAALFRLAPLDGEISIDDVSTSSLPLQEVRSKISIIPQEPVLFSATLRYNLDPLNNYSDSELWSALEAVELKDAVSSLEYHVCEGGSNFSLGQRQLICLARAILRNNKILVLDEATANVDPETDSFIQKTIRERFSDCTVLTIAHRLNTIMDSDRVLVMDKGRMVEFDHPHLLLKNREGFFSKMVKDTGNMAMSLCSIAKNAYQHSPSECTKL